MSETNPENLPKKVAAPIALLFAFILGILVCLLPQIGMAGPINALEREQDEAQVLLNGLGTPTNFKLVSTAPFCDIRKDCSDSTMTAAYKTASTNNYKACIALYEVAKEHLLSSYAVYKSGTIYNGEETTNPNAAISGYRLPLKSKTSFTKNCSRALNRYGGKTGVSRVYVYEVGNATAVPAIKYAQLVRYRNNLHLDVMASYRGIALDGFFTTERYQR